MIYSLLRSIGRVALRWYYADVSVANDVDVPNGPLIVVVNHPNALVDVLLTAHAVPRRLLFTAKSTLFSNPVARAFLSTVGVVPLRRASDEANPSGADRNAQSFAAIRAALAAGGAILIFPEGRSHDEPAMSVLKTGAARMALDARDTGGVRGLCVLPVGLVFERKERPRSRVLVSLGEVLRLDDWRPASDDTAVTDLTADIDRRLRAVTLNYETQVAADLDARAARELAAILRTDAPPVGGTPSLNDEAAIARLLPRVRAAAEAGGADLRRRVQVFESDLASLRKRLDVAGTSDADFTISRSTRHGLVFVVRESAILLVAGPVALWGWLNHVIPLRAALLVSRRMRDSAADPAMRTIVAAAAFLSAMYMAQSAVVAVVVGPWWALAYLVSLPLAADVNFRMADRLRRAKERARTYLLFRSKPAFQDRLIADAVRLRDEALSIAHDAGVISAA